MLLVTKQDDGKPHVPTTVQIKLDLIL